MRGYKIFAGSASVEFAKEVCQILDVPLAKASVKSLAMVKFLFKLRRVFVDVMYLSSNQLALHRTTT